MWIFSITFFSTFSICICDCVFCICVFVYWNTLVHPLEKPNQARDRGARTLPLIGSLSSFLYLLALNVFQTMTFAFANILYILQGLAARKLNSGENGLTTCSGRIWWVKGGQMLQIKNKNTFLFQENKYCKTKTQIHSHPRRTNITKNTIWDGGSTAP